MNDEKPASEGQIRSAWSYWRTQFEVETPAEVSFDAWLAEHDRAVAERAWNRGASAGIDMAQGFILYGSVEAANPYKPLSVSTPKDADT